MLIYKIIILAIFSLFSIYLLIQSSRKRSFINVKVLFYSLITISICYLLLSNRFTIYNGTSYIALLTMFIVFVAACVRETIENLNR